MSRIGIPYRIDFDTNGPRTKRGAPTRFVFGRGSAGWMVTHVEGEQDARSFLERLPRVSWMPGTRRLAQQLGVAE